MSLDELIETTTAEADSDQPLELLAAAAACQQQLVEQGDQLLDHFVQAARVGGYSWSQIGAVLGVSKQAVQQRHAGRPGVLGWLKETLGGKFTKLATQFSRDARQVVVLAQDEARQLGHGYIRSEHLLLGILAHGRGTGGETLAQFGVELDQARENLVAILGPTPGPDRSGHLPFSRRAKQVLELSLREATELGHTYIGTEHILLALITEDSDVAVDLLVRQAAAPAPLREELLRQLVHLH